MKIIITIEADTSDNVLQSVLQALSGKNFAGDVVTPANLTATANLDDCIKELVLKKGHETANKELGRIFKKYVKVDDAIDIPGVDDNAPDNTSSNFNRDDVIADIRKISAADSSKTIASMVKTVMKENYGVDKLDKLSDSQLQTVYEKVRNR